MSAVARTDRNQRARERPAPGPHTGLPLPACEGVLRAFLARDSHQRHPELNWIPAEIVECKEALEKPCMNGR
jgi:hypothetical protein